MNQPLIEAKSMSSSRLLVQYDTGQPIELAALSDGFAGISRQYSNFVREYTSEELSEEEVVLYVTKIESNCILTELAPYVGYGLAAINIIEWHNALKDFTESIRSYFQHFRNKISPQIKSVTKRDAEDFRDFLKVVAENKSGEIVTEVVKYDEGKKSSLLRYAYKPTEIAEAYEGVSAYLRNIETMEGNLLQKVLLYLPQLNVDVHKSTGRTADKGVIETVSTKPLPVFWLSELDSKRVKSLALNPHSVSYIVDVSVQKKRGIPRAYSVMALHDIIPDEET